MDCPSAARTRRTPAASKARKQRAVGAPDDVFRPRSNPSRNTANNWGEATENLGGDVFCRRADRLGNCLEERGAV